ncbi:MAG: dephospho-CoA kinase [Epsilonproteobacteria bacterium]|nr:MAG: dephospho-CoA kinase [Campylobacterota bacterium]
MAFKYAVVLTGSISTGKSTVLKLFSSWGIHTIDADKVAHQILQEQSVKIAEMFGESLIIEGKVSRKDLGAIVFSDVSKRQALEALLHPLIYAEIERLSLKEDHLGKPYLIDIPLFFEGGRYPIKKSLVVYATAEQQLDRLMNREGYSRQEALDRIDTQISVEEKRKMATYVIDNSGTLTQLKQECERVKEEILNDSY